MKKRNARGILLFTAADQYNDTELSGVLKVLRKAGRGIFIASDAVTVCKGSSGGRVRHDVRLENANAHNFEALIIIGGTGIASYSGNLLLRKLILDFHNSGKVIGAICAAPVVLAEVGILEGRRAACHSSVRKQIETAGASLTGNTIEADDTIVTAAGEADAERFAETVQFTIDEVKRT